MDLRDLTSRLTPRRRRRRPRADAPRTIVPLIDELEAAVPVRDASDRLDAESLDAARERLRREIAPPGDES